MDLRIKTRSKKTLTVVGIGVLVVLALVFYFVFLRTPSFTPQESSSGRADIIPEVDFSPLESTVLSRFRSWSVLPVTVGETGRENPFSQE